MTMKTHAIIAAIALFTPVAFAQEPAATATAETSVESRVEAAINELCVLQVQIVEILETVKDKESADAAAEELFLVIARVQELQYDAQQIRTCDTATQERLLKKLIEVTISIDSRKKAVGKFLVQNHFFNSEDLKAAVRMML
ncbi:MAG: hypothetical protein IKT79_10640 [Akkermansia sp.]|nr:hypothetical protein [Akkermansia sp.]